MDDRSLQFNLGSVRSLSGELTFSFVVTSTGSAHVQIFAFDPTNARKSGVLLTLDRRLYHQFKELIARMEETIAGLQSTGQADLSFLVRTDRDFSVFDE